MAKSFMTENAPKISIVTPSYEQAAFLGAAMDSVLDQGYPELEYIVIDGGSKDGSVDVIRERADRVAYWVSEPDQGQSDALAKGMARATGDIIGWLNSDDIYFPGAFARVAEVFSRMPSVDVVHGSCGIVDTAGVRHGTRRDIDFNRDEALFWTPIMQPEAFVRRRMLEKVGPPRADLHYLMDKEWWLRMAASGAVFQRIDDTLAALRYHGATKTSSQWQEEGYHRERDLVLRQYWDDFGLGFRLPRNEKLRRGLHAGMDFYSRVLHQFRIVQLYGRFDRISPSVERAMGAADRGKAGVRE